jgi:tripeptide aminopeptidase
VAPKINQRQLLRTFKDLVVIYGPGKRERDVADYVCDRLAGAGTVVEDNAADLIDGDAGNLLVRVDGTGDPLLFSAHLDTVEPCAGVKPRIKNGYVTSRGDTILGADDRAALAVLIELALLAPRLPHARPLELLLTVAEEIGLLGAKHADYGSVSARRGFVLDASEPPGYAVTAAPGSETVRATFRGRAAHAGIEPEKGVNAIQMASAAIAGMRLGRVDHETTANVGLISGGRAINVVPESAEISGEIRSHDASKLAAHKEHLTAVIKKAAADFGGEVETAWEVAYVSYQLDEAAEPVALFDRAARAVGLEPHHVAGGGGSDANVFNARGIPSLVMGCGVEKLHTTEERIAVAALGKLAELTTALVTTP